LPHQNCVYLRMKFFSLNHAAAKRVEWTVLRS
jgi:hypothetical protein